MPLVTRIAGSFAIVVIAYFAYALFAVPWIEPAADPNRSGIITEEERDRNKRRGDGQLDEIRDLFPASTLAEWKKNRPKIIESDRAKLLFQTYVNHPDGRVEIHPCTIIFTYEGPAKDEAERLRQAIILEAPGGAELKFDQPFELSTGKLGRLEGGQLKGQVRIRSEGKSPGPEDDLLIVGQDIRLTENTVSTPSPVDFRWGPHFGRGQDMLIKLLTEAARTSNETAGLKINGVESVELRRVERLHLDLSKAMSEKGKKAKGASDDMPVEIHCSGPFRFDVIHRVATFRDRVDVMKINLTGPADQIACDLLSIFFTERNKKKPGGEKAGSLDLSAERLEARGNPVLVSAPSMKNMIARGARIDYNIPDESITLDGGQEVFMQQGPNEIHARSLYYKAAAPGHLGHILSQGPGWIRGQSPDKPDQQLEAVWQGVMRVDPEGQNQHVISMNGGTELVFKGTGRIQAPEIFFWLQELPPKANSRDFQLRPYRMRARNNVRMNSPQLCCNVEELMVWFKEGAANAFSGRRNDGLVSEYSGQGLDASASGVVPVGAIDRLPPTQNPDQTPPVPQQYEVVGRTLSVEVLLGEQQQAAVSNMKIEGQKVSFQGGGMGVFGSNINFNRDTNRLWIDGEGEMELPIPGDMREKNLPVSDVLKIRWRRCMTFDGLTVQFQGAVVAASGQQKLATEIMNAKLDRRIDFSKKDSQEKQPQVEQIQCFGGVMMEYREFDKQQQLTAFNQMKLTDLAVNVFTGALTGGSGWMNSVRRGSVGAPNLGAIAGRAAAAPAPSSNQLTGMHVKFQKSISGTLPLPRPSGGIAPLLNLTFENQVRAASAPVDRWEAVIAVDDPDRLGPKGMTARCDRLTLAETLSPASDKRPMTMAALGNAVVEGSTLNPQGKFKAVGARITYEEVKDLLILEGDGRADAEVFWWKEIGVEPMYQAAKRILYWPKTNGLSIDGARSFQWNQLPAGLGTPK